MSQKHEFSSTFDVYEVLKVVELRAKRPHDGDDSLMEYLVRILRKDGVLFGDLKAKFENEEETAWVSRTGLNPRTELYTKLEAKDVDNAVAEMLAQMPPGA